MNNKKIVFQVTKAYMKKNKMRTRITFAGIFVMVVLMTAVFVGKDTVLRYLWDVAAARYGTWHATVYDIGENEVADIENLDYVEDVKITRSLGYSEFPQTGNPWNTPFLEVKGYSEGVFEEMNIQLIEGRYPENENEIIISERALEEGADISVGDTVELDTFERYLHAFNGKGKDASDEDTGFISFGPHFSVNHGDTVKVPAHFAYYMDNDDFEMIHESLGYKRTCTVVGIMEMPYYETKGMGGYIAITGTTPEVKPGDVVNAVITTDVNKSFNLSYDLNAIVNNYRTPEELAELEESGSGIIADGAYIPVENGRVEENDMLLMFAAKGSDGSINKIMIFFQAFFILMITVASLVLIYNVFSISFRERSKYLGMLSSVGATRAQKRWSVYYEVLYLLVFALPLGILAGLLLVKVGMMLLYPHFSKILGMVMSNVLLESQPGVGCHLVVRPTNLIFVVVFSALAVWISAWIPALKVGKTGPIESIRGGEKVSAKSHKSKLGLMKRGKAERMISSATVSRNKHTTGGIVRSVSAFIALTLVTAFASNSIIDLVNAKAEDSDFTVGSGFSGYSYVFCSDDADINATGREEILASDEVTEYRELHYNLFGGYIGVGDLSEEYFQAYEALLNKYFPNGISESIDQVTLHPIYNTANPSLNHVIVSDEEYEKLAKKAGIDPSIGTKDAPGVMVYQGVCLDTDQFVFDEPGSVTPYYARYEIAKPLAQNVGEEIPLYLVDFDEDTQEEIKIDTPVTFAGYLNDEDINEFVKINDGGLWIFVRETDETVWREKYGKAANGIESNYVFFNTVSPDSNILRNLAVMEDEFGNSPLIRAEMIVGLTSFTKAIASIVRIVAVCFTLLIAVMSLLNLYNSVMGRRLARQKELMVLRSIGLTGGQKHKMLCLENARLLGKSFLVGGVITTVFVVLLHVVISNRFGKILFHMPIWMIALTLLVSVVAMVGFTGYCYRNEADDSIVEGVRNETI